MPNTSAKLTWCRASTSEDMNWWVKEISDPVRWEIDGLGIIDPNQFQYLIDLMEPLNEYGLQTNIVEAAFYPFGIDKVDKDKTVLLRRTPDSILQGEEPLFALPNVMDEEKGPYADFLDHITRLRVKMLNDLIDFSQKLTIEELEEELRESQNDAFLEGRATHFFSEITDILEYVPEGFELDDEEVKTAKSEDQKLEDDLADIGESADSEVNLEADETMKWDEEEEEDFEDS